MLPIVALVGRPNTGKSTLFNRLVGGREAITSREAGTTRDRIYRQMSLGEAGKEREILLVDTGGIQPDGEGEFDANIIDQAKLAIAEADLIIFVTDSSEPLTKADQTVTQLLRKSGKEIVLVANKVDRKASQEHRHELFKLGFADPVEVSAINNDGILDLETIISKKLPAKSDSDNKADNTIKIGFLGKPNVGKSSLINHILGKEQVIVSEISGTTLDSTHLPFTYQDNKYTLIDTAGIRRRGKQVGLEKFGVLRTLQTIESVDVAFLIIDGSIGLAKQDMHVSEYILKGAKGLVIVVNKADLMQPEDKNKLIGWIQYRMQYVPWAPVIFVSAKTGNNVFKLLDIAHTIYEKQHTRIPTSEINYLVKKLTMQHQPQTHSSRIPKIQYVTQAESTPPQFIFFCRHTDNLHFSYRRYLENRLREHYDFSGVNIELSFKEVDRKQRQDRR